MIRFGLRGRGRIAKRHSELRGSNHMSLPMFAEIAEDRQDEVIGLIRAY